MNARLLRAHDQGRVQVTIGRAGELYGPAVESVLARALFGAAVAGRPARWFGDLDQPITPTYIEDFARGLVTLGERDEALGRAWHVPTSEPTTGRNFARAVFDAAGTRQRVLATGTRTARALGLVSPLAREGAEILYQFERRSSWTAASSSGPSAVVQRPTTRASDPPWTGTAPAEPR